MAYPKFVMKGRFYRGRTFHTFSHGEFGHAAPHVALCGAEGNLGTGWFRLTAKAKTCPVCYATDSLHERLAAGNPPAITWKRPYSSNVAHAVLDWNALPAGAPLCSAKVNSYVPGQDDQFEHCKVCQSIISAAQPEEEGE